MSETNFDRAVINLGEKCDRVLTTLDKISNSLNKVYDYIRDSAARKIQRGCHNWLYSPICKDGTIGIVPRLGWKKIENIK